MKLPYKNDKELANRINEVYKNKKVIQFSSYPVVSDLMENSEIAQDIINELRKPGNSMKDVLLKENPGMTTESIIDYIEAIIKYHKKSFWRNKWVLTFILALVVLLISLFTFKFTHRARRIDMRNSTISENITESENITDTIGEAIGDNENNQ